MSEKKYTPREAALAVLAKASELYKASSLAKSEKPMKKDGQTLGSAIGFPGAPPANPPMGKSDEAGHNPDEKADAKLGEKVEKEVQQHESQNADPGHAVPMKGHIKLAKFIGAMEQKRGTRAK